MMKNTVKFLPLIVIVAVLLFFFLRDNQKVEDAMGFLPEASAVKIVEVEQAPSYTYLLLKEGGQEYWAAIAKAEVEAGESIAYTDALKMTDFHSKELDKTFETIYFIQQYQYKGKQMNNPGAPAGMGMGTDMQMPPNTAHAAAAANKDGMEADINLSPVPGAKTIAELYKDRKKLDKKEIQVQGIVVKVNNEIMNRNWIHIQDGTEHNGNYDLTITSSEMVEEGDTVFFRGTLSSDKDFGAGYFYEVVIEDATQVR